MTPATHFLSPPEQPELTGPDLCALCAEQGGSCCATDPALGHLSFPLSGAEWCRLSPWAVLASEAESLDSAAFALAEQKAQAADGLGTATQKAADGLAMNSQATDGLAMDNQAADGRKTAQPQGAGPAPPEGVAPPAGDACCQPWDNSPEFIASMHALFPHEKERIGRLFPAGQKHLSLRLRRDGACVFLGRAGCRLPRSARPWYCLLFPAWMTDLGPGLFAARGCLIAGRAKNQAHGLKLMAVAPKQVYALFANLRRDWGLEDS